MLRALGGSMWSIKFVVMVCMTSAFCLTFSLSRGRFFVGDTPQQGNETVKGANQTSTKNNKKKYRLFTKIAKKKDMFSTGNASVFFCFQKNLVIMVSTARDGGPSKAWC